jgi:hypothetical protein
MLSLLSGLGGHGPPNSPGPLAGAAAGLVEFEAAGCAVAELAPTEPGSYSSCGVAGSGVGVGVAVGWGVVCCCTGVGVGVGVGAGTVGVATGAAGAWATRARFGRGLGFSSR